MNKGIERKIFHSSRNGRYKLDIVTGNRDHKYQLNSTKI